MAHDQGGRGNRLKANDSEDRAFKTRNAKNKAIVERGAQRIHEKNGHIPSRGKNPKSTRANALVKWLQQNRGK